MAQGRREYKYLLCGEQEEKARDIVTAHLTHDGFCLTQPGCQYPVYSLYLDSPGRALYWATANGERDRFKLRFRWYDPSCKGPAKCEVKSRCNEFMTKTKAWVVEDGLRDLLAGDVVQLDWFSKQDERVFRSALAFQEKTHQLAARPAAGVAYMREAFSSDEDENLRITFDREIRVAEPWNPGEEPGEWMPILEDGAVLEVKFRDTAPRWVFQMVADLELQRISYSKYGRAMEFLRERGNLMEASA